MGSGASIDTIELLKIEYLEQKNKPIDGNDCNNIKEAKNEIIKLRTLLKQINENDINLLLEEKKKQLKKEKEEKKEDEEFKSQQEEKEEKEGKEGQGQQLEESSIINELKDKLNNRILSLQEAFYKIDTTQSGYITKEEFIQSCWYWGIQLEENDFNLLSNATKDSQNRIQYNEFINLMTKIIDQKGIIVDSTNSKQIISRPTTSISSPTTADILRSRILNTGLTMKQAFLKFDKNGSGGIEKEEMKDVLQTFNINFTIQQLNELFNCYDLNRDNKFQYGEFVRIMQKKS